jgi:hypothetical protein
VRFEMNVFMVCSLGVSIKIRVRPAAWLHRRQSFLPSQGWLAFL